MNSRLLVLLAIPLALAACDAEGGGGSCGGDDACGRGEICRDDECTIIRCDRLGDCPGSGRTCLEDLRQCSAKECADINQDGTERTCSDDKVCLDDGPFRHSCVEPAVIPPDTGMLPVGDMGMGSG